VSSGHVDAAPVERTKTPVPVDECQWSFPHPEDPVPGRRSRKAADESGFLAFGADLSAATLVHSYRNGIFPWPSGVGAPLPWCSPNPRGVLGLDRLKISRSLRQTMQRQPWVTTMNRAFGDVLELCSIRPGEGTWIIPEMSSAYAELHRLGYAHSVEVWDGEELVGGLYGMLVGGVFTGESMFHRRTDASKVAFCDLAVRMLKAGGAFVDVQLPTEHLESLGVLALHRTLFLELLVECRDDDVRLCTDQLAVSRIPDEYAQRSEALSSQRL
jgi:leucyl/phenylalanyl-tRNA---protein transferase